MFTQAQIDQYNRDGYLILRSQFSEAEMLPLDDAFRRHPPLDGNTQHRNYPEPDRYTLAKNSWKDPAFVYFAENEAVVEGSRCLLDDDVHLTAWVLYDRTPGGPAIPKHNDYKRWRPVGSSMNWLFTIIPMCDFDESTGQLFIAPGSHRLERQCDRGEGALHMNPPVIPGDDEFIDPELKRGDLLFMNMHLWHRAAGNSSDLHRVGLFNKYTAKHCPPATGYYLYDDEIFNSFSEQGKNLIAVHSNKPIGTTRLLLQRDKEGEAEFFFVSRNDVLELPGGPANDEQAIPDWDTGNYIGTVTEHANRQIRVETPWASYVGDYDEGDHLCRIYGYPMNWNGFPVAYKEGLWLSRDVIDTQKLRYGYEMQVIDDWLDPTMIRGKGVSQAKARVDQYAF